MLMTDKGGKATANFVHRHQRPPASTPPPLFLGSVTLDRALASSGAAPSRSITRARTTQRNTGGRVRRGPQLDPGIRRSCLLVSRVFLVAAHWRRDDVRGCSRRMPPVKGAEAKRLQPSAATSTARPGDFPPLLSYPLTYSRTFRLRYRDAVSLLSCYERWFSRPCFLELAPISDAISYLDGTISRLSVAPITAIASVTTSMVASCSRTIRAAPRICATFHSDFLENFFTEISPVIPDAFAERRSQRNYIDDIGRFYFLLYRRLDPSRYSSFLLRSIDPVPFDCAASRWNHWSSSICPDVCLFLPISTIHACDWRFRPILRTVSAMIQRQIAKGTARSALALKGAAAIQPLPTLR